MRITGFQSFLSDEQGGYTIWSLTWFMIYLSIGGLAVDVSDAYRNRSLLQATADAAALAAVMELPDGDAAVTTALTYSSDNMDPSYNGQVLRNAEVVVGTWNYATESFASGGALPNAVHVTTRRAAPNNNPVAMNFLRVLRLVGIPTQWDIATEAIAARYVPECVNDGLIALNRVDTQSNNDFLRKICVHAQRDGVAVRQNNYFAPDVQVSMGDLDDLFVPDMDGNEGLAEALVEGDIWPRDIAALDGTLETMLNLDTVYHPAYEYMYQSDGNGGLIYPDKVTAANLPATIEPYTVYDIDCDGQLTLPGGMTLSNVVVVASCRIHSAANLTLRDVALFSTDTSGGGAAINMAAKTTLGAADDCAMYGGVELYAYGDMHIAAQGDWHGLRIVSGSDVAFTARNVGIHGMSVQAINIDFTSNNAFGICTGNVPGIYVWHYRLVR